jgi:hypothetical protein
MLSDTLQSSSVREDLQVLLDGCPVDLPYGHRSLSAIRSYLESLALQQQRVLYSFSVDGAPALPRQDACPRSAFFRVEAQTLDLDEMPVRLLDMAVQQVSHADSRLQSAISLVLINDGSVAREFWWDLARELKQPLLTLALLPDAITGSGYAGASVSQLRKWQLQQLGAILMDVDEACRAKDPMFLAAALETRVAPWLSNLRSNLELLRETVLSGFAGRAGF